MAANKNEVVKNGRNPRTWHPIASAVIGAVLGSGGSLGIVFSTPIGQELTRPNPYTSIEATSAHREIDRRLITLEAHTGQNHPDVTNQFDRRITTVEVNQQIILTQLERIIEKLDQR